MQKLLLLSLITALTAVTNSSFAQLAMGADSVEFCGRYAAAPKDCETQGNLIKCTDYVFTWTYEPVADLPRHKKEMLAQTKNFKKVNVSVAQADQTGFIGNIGASYLLLVIGKVNGQGVIINLWLNKPIKTTNDLPEYVRQFISIK